MKLNNKGYMGIQLALMLFIIPIATVIGVRTFYGVQRTSQVQHSTMSKSQMTSIKNWLMSTGNDADSDGNVELLKEGGSNILPVSLPLKGTDDYGTAFRYYTWDLGAANGNAIYSQNNVAPPLVGLVGRVISSGKDGVFQTNAASTSAGGDDILVDILNSDVLNNKNSSGWIEDVVNNKITQITPGRFVGINEPNPTQMLDVNGMGKFQYAQIGTGATGFYQDTNNGAYRSPATAGDNGFFVQSNAGALTTAYFGLQGAYAGKVGIGTTSPLADLHMTLDKYILFGPNSFGANLRLGGIGNGDSNAAIYTTNGNLHIDAAQGGYATFLNYYKGTGGVYFGNGAGGTALVFDSAGNMTFTSPNPIISASSYFIAPGGAHFNSGAVYAEASIRARGGLQNDTGANLLLRGGTSGTTEATGDMKVDGQTIVSATGIKFSDGTVQTTASTTKPIICDSGNIAWGPAPGGAYTYTFLPANCTNGVLPDGTYVGVFAAVDVCGGAYAPVIKTALDVGGPGIAAWNVGPCGWAKFKAVYLKK